MSIRYPILYCPDMAAKQAAIRALYTLGFRRAGQMAVEEGLLRANPHPMMNHVIPFPEPQGISFAPPESVLRKDLTLVNSIAHMLSYIKRAKIAPTS